MPHADAFFKETKKEQLRKEKKSTLSPAKNAIPKSTQAQEILELSRKISELSAKTQPKSFTTPKAQIAPQQAATQAAAQKAAQMPIQPFPTPKQQFTQSPTLQRQATYQAFPPASLSPAAGHQSASNPLLAYSPASSGGDLVAPSMAEYQAQANPATKSNYWNAWMNSALQSPKANAFQWQEAEPDALATPQSSAPKSAEMQRGFQGLSAYENMRATDAKRQFISDWLQASAAEDETRKAYNPLLTEPQLPEEYSAVWRQYQQQKDGTGNAAKDFAGLSQVDTGFMPSYNKSKANPSRKFATVSRFIWRCTNKFRQYTHHQHAQCPKIFSNWHRSNIIGSFFFYSSKCSFLSSAISRC